MSAIRLLLPCVAVLATKMTRMYGPGVRRKRFR